MLGIASVKSHGRGRGRKPTADSTEGRATG